MFVQTVLEKVKIKAEFPTFRFLFMFTGIIGGALLAVGVRDLNSFGQPNLMWLALALSVLSGILLSGERFRLKALRLLPVSTNHRT